MICIRLFISACVATLPLAALACDDAIAAVDVPHFIELHENLLNEPSQGTATAFLADFPRTFCVFNGLFGYSDEGAAALYEQDLFSSLPLLNSFADSTSLSAKYVAIAADAKWDVDNVNALQAAYRDLFGSEKRIVIADIMALPADEQMTATRFFFDGFYPKQKFLAPNDRLAACEMDQSFCSLLDLVEQQLVTESL
ncbi:hypothetical protein [Yoonia maritima]|uniref:hypothetical protein n=1 Tax=Yoonia maritima TaxID=1435347 RepID=UPI000D0F8618|nr:hypothetical protein [Yoonia maritima]